MHSGKNDLVEALRFEPLSEDDLVFLNEVRNSAAPFLHDPRVFTVPETRSWFGGSSDTRYWITTYQGKRIGYFRTRPQSETNWQIGADLHESFRGQGLAKPAYVAFAKAILEPRGVTICTLRVLKSNQRGVSLYLSLGFRVIAETENDYEMLAETDLLTRYQLLGDKL